ncbi:MAG: hypothetical protein E2O84_03850, partial [Bacteroidetes bacterium]
MPRIFSVLVFIILTWCPSSVEAQEYKIGSIAGSIVDANTLLPLSGATVTLNPAGTGLVTSESGQYIFAGIPVGTYSLEIRYLGYEAIKIYDVVVRVDRTTSYSIALKEQILESGEVVVHGGSYTVRADQELSVTVFGAEEVRRAPGSAGDVSRILGGLPSITKVDDTKNALMVRGGSPFENGFYIDNIQVPNINHFPTQGSSGGVLGMVNVDLLESVEFSAGGFSAEYGDRLSALVDIRLREGDRSGFKGQADFSLSGIGGVLEGPLGQKKIRNGLTAPRGSWMISVRRSYLDFIVNTFFEEEASTVPIYSDAQVKIVYDLSPAHSLTVIGLFGLDESEVDREGAL